jgi:transposase
LSTPKSTRNHPAQYLKQTDGSSAGRSGKLAAFDELLDIIIASGEPMLVFTQFTQLAAILQEHLDRRGDTDKLLTSRFRDHPQARIIESLPGMGPILGGQFLVTTDGRALEAFASPGRLASYAGLVPVRGAGHITRLGRVCGREPVPLRERPGTTRAGLTG